MRKQTIHNKQTLKYNLSSGRKWIKYNGGEWWRVSGEAASDVWGSLFENVTFKPRSKGLGGATGWWVGETFQAKI